MRQRKKTFNYDDEYGLVYYPFAEELKLPKAICLTRGCKVNLVETCDKIIWIANQIRVRAKIIPEENSVAHAKLVNEYDRAVEKAWDMLCEAENVGRI